MSFSLQDAAGRTYIDGSGAGLGAGRFRVVAQFHRLVVNGPYVLRIGLVPTGGHKVESLVYDITAKSR